MTKQMFEDKLKESKSVEEVIAVFKEAGCTISQEDAEDIFDRMKSAEDGELLDDELENVSGGVADEEFYLKTQFRIFGKLVKIELNI